MTHQDKIDRFNRETSEMAFIRMTARRIDRLETELAELKAKQTQDPPSGKNEGSPDSEDAPLTVGQFKTQP